MRVGACVRDSTKRTVCCVEIYVPKEKLKRTCLLPPEGYHKYSGQPSQTEYSLALSSPNTAATHPSPHPHSRVLQENVKTGKQQTPAHTPCLDLTFEQAQAHCTVTVHSPVASIRPDGAMATEFTGPVPIFSIAPSCNQACRCRWCRSRLMGAVRGAAAAAAAAASPF